MLFFNDHTWIFNGAEQCAVILNAMLLISLLRSDALLNVFCFTRKYSGCA